MGQRKYAYLAAILTSVFIGLTFLFTKISLEFAGPFTTLAFRFSIALFVMVLLAVFGPIKFDMKKKYFKDLIVLSIFQPILYFSFQAFGLMYIPSSEVGVIFALTPIFVGIFGMSILKEKVNLKQFMAFILSISGVLFLFLMKGKLSSDFNMLGVLFSFISVIATSMFIITSRKLSKSIDAMTLTYGMTINGAIVFVFLAIGLEGMTIDSSLMMLQNSEFMYSILYLSLFTTVATFFLNNYSLSILKAADTAVFMNLSTIISILAGVLFLKEEFRYYHLIGSILIVSGIVLANYFSKNGGKEIVRDKYGAKFYKCVLEKISKIGYGNVK